MLIKGPIGEIREWDEIASFGSLAVLQKKPAIVFLDSLGGKLMVALKIGLLIHKYGFSTAVADMTNCFSVCALIWIAGKERYIGAGALVGFHAPRASRNDLGLALGFVALGNQQTDFHCEVFCWVERLPNLTN